MFVFVQVVFMPMLVVEVHVQNVHPVVLLSMILYHTMFVINVKMGILQQDKVVHDIVMHVEVESMQSVGMLVVRVV
jgi:hypothetical protein